MTRRLVPIAIVIALVIGALGFQVWIASQSADIAPATETPPTPSIRCVSEAGPMPSVLAADPCPSAITAVELAVAPVRLPIARIVIEPGPFYCDVIWPGAHSTPPCRGAAALRGQFMHAWVAFDRSDEVAVVMLGLDLPDDTGRPGATRPPWRATLVATEVPPAGWVMP